MRKFRLTVILLFIIFSVLHAQSKREMRAVWIATVANIDWPSSNRLLPTQQRTEIVNMLDQLAENNINAIVLQIRPMADAFYPSTLEPWSHWLTGRQGMKPSPFYDPLQFIIEEAHRRCMEIHVWLNPYRVTTNNDSMILSKDHLFFRQPELFVRYGGKYYFNPGLDETRNFLNKVVEDIVEHYDVDGVHFDDYFYPYPVKGEDFPDDETFMKYPRGFAPSQKADWRRNNVNMTIAEVQQTIKSIKPWVEFGVSPFGVWRNDNVDPRGSATRAGIQNYDDLYADILKWLAEGTVDYVTPQLYWEIGKKVANYEILLKWWIENSYGKNLYIGLIPSSLGDKKNSAWTTGNEIIRQIKMNRSFSQVDGAVFFSAKTFLQNRQGLNDSLRSNYYRYPALCPVNRNIVGEPSAQPQNLRVLRDGKDAFLLWEEVNEEGGCQTAYYVVYAFKGKEVGDMNNPANIIARTTENCIDLRTLPYKFKGNYTFVVTAVNRFRQESIPTLGITRKL
jgi:uncharacterized lipoprotein YddW (UPF0748 family)